MDQLQLPIRNPGLYSGLRAFVAAALELLRDDVAAGAEPSFSVGVHRDAPGAPGLYEFQPLAARFVLERARRIAELPATEEAAWTVASDPAAMAFLRAGTAGQLVEPEQVARDEVLLPLLTTMAELNPGFELDEDALLQAYLRLESSLYGDGRRYAAAVPIAGLRLAAGDLLLADGVRLRSVDPELFRLEWPEAAQLNWGGDGGLPGVVLEFERLVGEHDSQAALDPVPAVEQFLSVVRTVVAGAAHAGPYVLERLDFRTLAPRPVSPLAAVRCGSVTSVIDPTVASVLPGALRRLAKDPHGVLARGIERYQVAMGMGDASSLRLVLDALTDLYAAEGEHAAAALRIAAVVGPSLAERRQLADAMRLVAVAVREGRLPDEQLRQAGRLLAAALRTTLAAALVGDLPLTHVQAYADGILLGERERRQLGVTALRPVLQT